MMASGQGTECAEIGSYTPVCRFPGEDLRGRMVLRGWKGRVRRRRKSEAVSH